MWLTCLSSPYVLFADQSTIVLSWIDFPPLVQSSDARHLPSFIIIDSCVTLIYDPNHLNFLMIYTYFKIILNKNYGHFPAKFYNRIFGTFIYRIYVYFARGLNNLGQFQIRVKFKVLLNKSPIFWGLNSRAW